MMNNSNLTLGSYDLDGGKVLVKCVVHFGHKIILDPTDATDCGEVTEHMIKDAKEEAVHVVIKSIGSVFMEGLKSE